MGMGGGQHGHGVPPGATAETAGTSNPSNEANVNSEFIDVQRKIPRILCERYELTDVLGKGAHGRIYLATDLVTHDKVAIKLVSFETNELIGIGYIRRRCDGINNKVTASGTKTHSFFKTVFIIEIKYLLSI